MSNITTMRGSGGRDRTGDLRIMIPPFLPAVLAGHQVNQVLSAPPISEARHRLSLRTTPHQRFWVEAPTDIAFERVPFKVPESR